MVNPTTSGTVATTVFRTSKIIDHAIRRCKIAVEQATPQMLQIALDCLFLELTSMGNKGIPLWTIERNILPLYQGQFQIPLPDGTEDILNVNLRTLQRVGGINTASEGNADYAFDGDVTTACTQTTAGGTIEVEFSDSTNLTMIGILPNSSGSWSIAVETSTDGIEWNPVYTNTTYAAVNGEWLWVDLDDPENVLQSSYQNAIYFVRLRAVSPTILDVREFYLANSPQEIPMALINRDDYANLPDHTFQGRPVQYWYNRQLSPQLWIWPAANAAAIFQQLILYRHRQIQDVGSLNGLIEVPQRWYDPIIGKLALRLCDELKEVEDGRKEAIRPDVMQAVNDAWNEETDRGPVFFRPNISPYTR